MPLASLRFRNDAVRYEKVVVGRVPACAVGRSRVARVTSSGVVLPELPTSLSLPFATRGTPPLPPGLMALLFSSQELEGFARLALKYNLFVISDEARGLACSI